MKNHTKLFKQIVLISILEQLNRRTEEQTNNRTEEQANYEQANYERTNNGITKI
ncbi:MAG TPA: hypothetical protein PLL66_08590 [Bacteroidales bacterium]|nr:hypothetical protein [Bacteroidales bacterium]